MNEESRRMGVEIIRIPVGPKADRDKLRKKRFEEQMERLNKNMAYIRERLGTTVQEAIEAFRGLGLALARVAKVKGLEKGGGGRNEDS